MVTTGSQYCTIDAAGCVTDGFGAHGNNEACTVQVNQAGVLTATEFDTESCCDHVTIAGERYVGAVGPSNVAVAAGSTFTWSSDGSVTNSGWTICLAPTPPVMRVVSGGQYCTLDAAGCVTDGFGAHGNNEACTVQVTQAGVLTATEFATERTHDRVTIAGQQYSGTVGPSNVAVAVGSTFTWHSDHSGINAGWTICWATPAPTLAPTPAPTLAPMPSTLSPTLGPTSDGCVDHTCSFDCRGEPHGIYRGTVQCQSNRIDHLVTKLTDTLTTDFAIERGPAGTFVENHTFVCGDQAWCQNIPEITTTNYGPAPWPAHVYSFKFEGNTNPWVRFSTCGSEYDTYLALYNGNTGEELEHCDDWTGRSCPDLHFPDPLVSECHYYHAVLDVQLNASTSYTIVITGYNRSTGPCEDPRRRSPGTRISHPLALAPAPLP